MEYAYSLDFQKIRKITQVDDIQSLEFYLNNIYKFLETNIFFIHLHYFPVG